MVDRLANRMKNEPQSSTETIAVDGGSRTGATGGSPKVSMRQAAVE